MISDKVSNGAGSRNASRRYVTLESGLDVSSSGTGRRFEVAADGGPGDGAEAYHTQRRPQGASLEPSSLFRGHGNDHGLGRVAPQGPQ